LRHLAGRRKNPGVATDAQRLLTSFKHTMNNLAAIAILNVTFALQYNNLLVLHLALHSKNTVGTGKQKKYYLQ